jgi:membrane-bound serine protease (ClpP class)
MGALDFLWTFLTNPNVTYLLLVAGVWCVVMAATIPGIGLPESAAVVCLALAAIGLVRLQANLAGLGLIGVALVLFILEFRFMSHGAFLACGIVSMIIGSLLLFRGEGTTEMALSWVTVVAVTVLTAAPFTFFVYKGLGAQTLPVTQDPNRVVGASGVAHTDINAGGTVYAAGEEWSAYADEKISRGSLVTVVSRQGLKLKVAKAGKVSG